MVLSTGRGGQSVVYAGVLGVFMGIKKRISRLFHCAGKIINMVSYRLGKIRIAGRPVDKFCI
jgi:hypothetical protein